MITDEQMADRIAEIVAEGDGFWRTCSGCYETCDGQNVYDYPHSETFNCTQGSGCGECGGIGVTWDDTDYEGMARDLAMSSAQPSVDVEKALRRANDRLGGVEVPQFGGDNLAVFLCSYLEDVDDEGEEDECGWKPSATEGCEAVLKAIGEHYSTAIRAALTQG